MCAAPPVSVSAPGSPRLLLGAALTLLSVAGCAAGDPPRFEQVNAPLGAVRGEALPRVTARVVDDREVAAVIAVVLDEAALAVPGALDSAGEPPEVAAEGGFSASVDLQPQGEDLWSGELPVPPAGDLFFYLVASDAEDNLARAPTALGGEADSPEAAAPPPLGVYVVPVRDRPVTAPAPVCEQLSCEADEVCHPDWGVCLPADHCALPEVRCPEGVRCDPATGHCTPFGRCPESACPEWQACEPVAGRCLPVGHCALPGEGCGPDQICDDGTGRCFRDDDCTVLGVTCPSGMLCDPARGVCESADPCERQACGEDEACDTVSGLCEPLPSTLCAPCASSAECGGEADLCIVYGPDRGCGRDCRERECPPAYVCEPYGSDDRQCVRSVRTCRPEAW